MECQHECNRRETPIFGKNFGGCMNATNLIELKSIGHYFDQDNKLLYPINKDGSPDIENDVLVSEVEQENGISTQDWKIIHNPIA
jgi:hypothetical protein